MNWLRLTLKRFICTIGLGDRLNEFCGLCGRETDLVWWSPDDLWADIVGESTGIRCTQCFNRACYERGLLLRWRPEIAHRRSAGEWQ